jgi:hypothetical protein
MKAEGRMGKAILLRQWLKMQAPCLALAQCHQLNKIYIRIYKQDNGNKTPVGYVLYVLVPVLVPVVCVLYVVYVLVPVLLSPF